MGASAKVDFCAQDRLLQAKVVLKDAPPSLLALFSILPCSTLPSCWTAPNCIVGSVLAENVSRLPLMMQAPYPCC
jgi:hypothetical protein